MPSTESREFWERQHAFPQFGAPERPFDLDELRRIMGARCEPADPAVRCRPVEIDGLPGEWVTAPGADPARRLLYLHGGGYVSGTGANYLPLAAELSAATGCAVLLPDYRLAPEHPFPAGLEDCVRAHGWLRAHGPDGPAPARATFVAGDSAGGGLTLATMLALRDRGLPLPCCGIALSAFTDLTLASDSIASRASHELYMHPDCLSRLVALYAPPQDRRNPLASPVFGDYAGVPPLLIQVGDFEVIRDDSVRVAARARATGCDATLEVWPGQVHVFQLRGLPESREAIAHIAAFLQACMGAE